MNHPFLSSITISCLIACAGCHGNDDPMMMSPDQVHTPMDMGSSTMPDAADPNAPGMVRYSYICDDKPEKTVEVPHVRFGATYNCSFKSDYFMLNVKDDRIPLDFRLSIPNYHGPGVYNYIADEFSGRGFAYCEWPSFQVADSNCPAMRPGQIGACCLDRTAQAKALSCTVTVTQHSLTRCGRAGWLMGMPSG